MSKNIEAFPGASKTAGGMLFNGAVFQPVIEKCEGCARIREFEGDKFCSSYAIPEAKWSMGVCNFSTHARASLGGGQSKVNPLKASKRAAKGKR